MLEDRIRALREANKYNIHTDRHVIGLPRITGDGLMVEAPFAVFTDRPGRPNPAVRDRPLPRPAGNSGTAPQNPRQADPPRHLRRPHPPRNAALTRNRTCLLPSPIELKMDFRCFCSQSTAGIPPKVVQAASSGTARAGSMHREDGNSMTITVASEGTPDAASTRLLRPRGRGGRQSWCRARLQSGDRAQTRQWQPARDRGPLSEGIG